MKSIYILISLVIVSGVFTQGKELSISELNSSKIIGRLGKPIHEVHYIECKVVDMSFTRKKADQGRMAMLILKVDHKPLPYKSYVDLPKFVRQKDVKVGQILKSWAYETLISEGFPDIKQLREEGYEVFVPPSVGLHIRAQIIFCNNEAINKIEPEKPKAYDPDDPFSTKPVDPKKIIEQVVAPDS